MQKKNTAEFSTSELYLSILKNGTRVKSVLAVVEKSHGQNQTSKAANRGQMQSGRDYVTGGL